MTNDARAILDRWVANTVDSENWENPDLEVVEALVRRLDQAVHTLLMLERGATHMAIGGGGGRYVVYMENVETGDRYDLLGESDDDAPVEIVAGGQRGEYPSRLVVGPEAAEVAAEHFLRFGEPSPALTWGFERSD